MTTSVIQLRGKNAIIGMFFVMFAALGGTMLHQSRVSWAGVPIPGDPGPFFMIRICLSVIGLTGAVTLIRVVRRHGHTPIRPPSAISSIALPAAFVIALIAMPMAMQLLGTISATALFAVIWIAVLMGRQVTSLFHIAISAFVFGVGAALFIQLVFVRLLTLPLP